MQAAEEAAAQAAPAYQGPAQVTGVLVEMGTRRPLPGFPIIATDSQGNQVEVTTAEDGTWGVGGLSPGKIMVSSTYPGYERVSKSATLGSAQASGDSTVELKLWIRNLSYRDDEIIGVYRIPSTDVTKRTVTVEEIKRIPGTFGDPVRVVQNLPGAARAPLGTGLLVIRGANPEDSGVYVDGIRIPFIYHLGGYVSVINADLIDSIDYLPGGFGVEYGRSMGGVLDVKTKTTYPERHKISWSTDVLDSGGLYQGRLGKQDNIGVAVAARRSYIDVFIPYVTADTGFTIKPRWYDYQLKVDKLDIPDGKLNVFVFGFEDTIFASTPDDFAQGTDQDGQGDIGTQYGTHRMYVQYEKKLSDQLAFRLIPSFGIDTAEFNLGSDFTLYQWQSIIEVRSELEWAPSPAITLAPGVDFLGGWYGFDVGFPLNPESFADYDPLGEREPWSLTGTGSAWGPDLYLEARLRPFEDRDKLLVVPGVRSTYVAFLDQFDILAWDPRVAVRYKPTKTGTLKAGTGLYHQPPQPFESYRPEGGIEIDYERSWATEVGWEQALGESIEADVALFYKYLDEQIVDNPNFDSLDDQFNTNDGIGRIAGTEVIIKKLPTGKFFGWVSYTLSRSMRNDYPEDAGADQSLWPDFESDDGWYYFDFDQTHILVLVAGYDLPRDWGVSGKVQYVTGNPYTPQDSGVYDMDQDFYYGFATTNYNEARLPPFQAVDLRVDKTLTFKRAQLELFVDLLNVYRGENPEFVVYNYDYTESAYIRGLPFIPSPGFELEVEF